MISDGKDICKTNEQLLDDIKSDMKGIRNLGIEITNDMLKKYAENKCNMDYCRYNQDEKCTNEDKRKECVEVSMKVLCLEDMENGISDNE